MRTCRDWGRRFMRLYPQYTSWDNPKDPERPLVVGYVSPDYFTHSVSYFIEAPLVNHDYANYKVVVYSAVVKVLAILKYSVKTAQVTYLCCSAGSWVPLFVFLCLLLSGISFIFTFVCLVEFLLYKHSNAFYKGN